MKIKRSEFTFEVKQRPDGAPWIAAEPRGKEVVFKGLLGFDLPSETTLEQAKEIAAYMQRLFRSISYMRTDKKKKKKEKKK
jgi:hypothetical protein